jgi:hypothetical protein
MKHIIILFVFILSGCATTLVERRQYEVLDCVKDLRGTDAPTLEAFEVCRQVYGLKKIKE